VTVSSEIYGGQIMPHYHPWRILRSMVHVSLDWVDDLPPGVLADTDGVGHVRMARWQLQVEARVSITHEIVHLERGDTCGSSDAIEAAVRRETARRLIRLNDLASSMLFYGEDWPAAAGSA
jgi:hypothetical protein